MLHSENTHVTVEKAAGRNEFYPEKKKKAEEKILKDSSWNIPLLSAL